LVRLKGAGMLGPTAFGPTDDKGTLSGQPMTTVRALDELGTVLPSRTDDLGTHPAACTDDHGTKPKVLQIILRNPKVSRDGDRCTRIIGRLSLLSKIASNLRKPLVIFLVPAIENITASVRVAWEGKVLW